VRVAALILAAGRGTRLGGVAKACLRLCDGRTFVEAIAAAARAAGCTRVVVVAAEPHLAATRSAAATAGCDVVVNPAPERGMGSSLAAGLEALDPADFDAALDWPVDHPRVGAATCAAILAAVSRDGIVVPTFEGRGGHPTAFGAAVWPELAASAEQGARSVMRSRPDRVRRVEVRDPFVGAGVDTPEAYAAIRGG
jgi:CTP:molybdopterin cytidylyltransferase MocA